MANQELWCQQTHGGCGGEIVAVVKMNKSGLGMACKTCKKVWTEILAYPDDWEMVLVSAPNDGRIHLSNKVIL